MNNKKNKMKVIVKCCYELEGEEVVEFMKYWGVFDKFTKEELLKYLKKADSAFFRNNAYHDDLDNEFYIEGVE